MTDLRVNSEKPTVKAEGEGKLDLKSSTEQIARRPKTIDKKAEELTERLQKEIIVAKSDSVLSPPEIEPFTDSQKNELIARVSPKLTDLIYLISYWETDGRRDRSNLQQIQEKLAEIQRLRQTGDTEGLFKWVLNKRYEFQKPPSLATKISEKIKWKLGGSKYQNELIAKEIGFLEKKADECQPHLGNVEQKITPTEEEEEELKAIQAVVAELEDKADRATKKEKIPDSLEELRYLKEEIESLRKKMRQEGVSSLSLRGKLKTLAQSIYERNRYKAISLKKRKEVTKLVKQAVEEEIETIERKSQSVGQNFSKLAELAKERILLKLIKEASTIAEEYSSLLGGYNQIRAKRMDRIIDQLSELATALGRDDIDVRRKFKRDKEGRVVGVYNESPGGILSTLNEQMKAGIDFKEREIIIYDSIEEALGPELQKDLESPLLVDQKPKKDRYDPNIRAYEAIAGRFSKDKIPSEEVHFKLIEHGGSLLAVLEHDLNEQLAILEVMDAKFPKNKETDREEEWINVKRLLLINKKNGQVFDIGNLLPKDFTLRYINTSSSKKLSFFSAEYGKYSSLPNERYIQYSDLSTAEEIAALFHEFGHHIVTTNSDMVLARRLEQLRLKERFQSVSNMSKQEFVATKKLLVANERGAWARALWLVRELKRKGIDIGIGIKEISKLSHYALQTYEKKYPQLYPEIGKKFTHKTQT